MNFSKIILFSTLYGIIANGSVFSTSINQSFNTMSTNYIARDFDADSDVYQTLDSRNTTEQIANASNKCNECIVTNNNRQTIANVPSETRPIKMFIPYKRMRSQTINPSITIKQQNNLIQDISEYNNVFKSASQMCSNNKLKQIEINLSCSDISSDSYSDNNIECKCNNNNTNTLQDEKTSRKSTGISPSQGSSNSENQNVNNKESSNKTIDNRNRRENTTKKSELLTDKEKIIIKYIKDNILNNRTKLNNNINLHSLKKTNTKMNYISVKNNENSKEKNNIENINSTNKNKIILQQDIKDSTEFITQFIKNTNTMTIHGIYDQVYYNTKYDILNESIDKVKSNQIESVSQNTLFNNLKDLLNKLLSKDFEDNKNSAIKNYFDECIFNYNLNNITDPLYKIKLLCSDIINTNEVQNKLKKVDYSYNKENNPQNIVDPFYKIKLSSNDIINTNEVQNKLKNINLEYKNEHINNIIEIYEQWKDLYNKYNNLYRNLIDPASNNQSI